MAKLAGSIAVVLIIAAFLLGAVSLLNPSASPAPQWKAVRDLAINEQIAETDLAGPTRRSELAKIAPKDSLIGKHVRVPKKAGDLLTPADLRPDPVFPVGEKGSGIWKYSIKDVPHLADGIHIGSWVSLCAARENAAQLVTTCSRLPFQVEAVHLSASDPYIALRVCPCQQADVGHFVATPARFLRAVVNPGRRCVKDAIAGK